MTRLTLLLLIDAFRRDYVTRTRYIRDLASTSAVGALREDFGFVPRAAYFGGLTPSRSGFTNMYCFDPVRSPFGAARGLPQSRHGRDIEERVGIRAWIEEEARRRVPAYAAAYLSSADIPIRMLPLFDLVEKRAPWDRRVGYRSIFHELEDRSVQYFCCAWPETNRLTDSSDDGIVAETLAHLRPPVQFAFVHLQQLDAIGHAYGPESSELLAALDRTDGLVEKMLSTLQGRFDRVDVVLFGDHGMVSVTRTADVWGAIERAGMRLGDDVPVFLDSTMARFWPPTSAVQQRVTAALEGLPGRILTGEEMARLDLRGCDSRNGELIFLAHPGVLVFPNFFQRGHNTVRGMHGYDPDCPDNQGIFIVRDLQTRPGNIGVVGPTRVHRELTRLLFGDGDDVAAGNDSRVRSQSVRRFTQHPDPSADALVAQHMTRIVEEVHRIVDADAIVLTGSFGRAEGGVATDHDGRYRPVNDYDVLVIAKNPPQAQSAHLRDLGSTLAEEFGTDFVHVSVWPRVDPDLPLTLANYDIVHGSRVLWGPPTLLGALPRFAGASIPIFEGVQLLFNRLAGMLTARRHESPMTSERYVRNQMMKGLMALGDWHLLRAQAYDSSYRVRRSRFAWLAPGLQLESRQRALIDAAYQYKISPDDVALDIPAHIPCVLSWLTDAAVAAVATVAEQRIATPIDASHTYYELTTRDAEAIAADNAFITQTFAEHATIRVRPSAASVRQSIYSAIPLVAAGSAGDRDAFSLAVSQLNGCLSPACPEQLTDANWQIVNNQLADAWLTMVH